MAQQKRLTFLKDLLASFSNSHSLRNRLFFKSVVFIMGLRELQYVGVSQKQSSHTPEEGHYNLFVLLAYGKRLSEEGHVSTSGAQHSGFRFQVSGPGMLELGWMEEILHHLLYFSGYMV